MRHNGYSVDSDYNPIAYNPYVLENDIVQRYNFYVVEEFISNITLSYEGMTRLKLPLISINNVGWNCTVDWGDGIVENYTYPTIPDHTYLTSNKRYVKISGVCSGLNYGSTETTYRQFLTEIIKMDSLDLRYLSFQGCSNLYNIQNGFNCPNVYNFDYSFYGCSNLSSVPSDLFYNCITATTFSRTFEFCTSLQSIPSTLFNNCINVTDFQFTFKSCTALQSIPSGLFNNCPNVVGFQYVFERCDKITSIPSGLFNNCPNVVSFQGSFTVCTSLQSIPSGLFNNCPNVTNFNTTFNVCYNLTGNAPSLWERTIPNLNGLGCFRECTKLSNYPQIPLNWK